MIKARSELIDSGAVDSLLASKPFVLTSRSRAVPAALTTKTGNPGDSTGVTPSSTPSATPSTTPPVTPSATPSSPNERGARGLTVQSPGSQAQLTSQVLSPEDDIFGEFSDDDGGDLEDAEILSSLSVVQHRTWSLAQLVAVEIKKKKRSQKVAIFLSSVLDLCYHPPTRLKHNIQ